MEKPVHFTMNIHAAPVVVRSSPENGGALTLCFSEFSYPDITMFCGSAEHAVDLHAAIAGVIAKHAAQPATSELEAA